MLSTDFIEHNEEVKRVWDTYRNQTPIRVPMILGFSSRFYLLNKEINTEQVTYRDYFDSPQVMLKAQASFQHFIRHNILQDMEMGLPEDGWTVSIDFQNNFDAAWFGCELIFVENQCPDTKPVYLDDERKWAIFEKNRPRPFEGFMGRVREFYEHFVDQKDTFIFRGKPIKEVNCSFPAFTDGMFTLGCQLRKAENFLADMLLDPEYYHKLMDYITTALIERGRAWRQYLSLPDRDENTYMADDYIQMISREHYTEFVLPYHKRYYDAFSKGEDRSMHLCGNVQRHLPTIHSELGVNHFDTGFPISFSTLRDDPGPDVEILGGPHIELLLNGSQESVLRETRDILESGIMKGGRFILREANNMAPGTPLENIEAMYRACKQYGKYQD